MLPPTALVCQCQVNFGLVTTLLQPLRLAPITRGASLSPAHQRPRVAMFWEVLEPGDFCAPAPAVGAPQTVTTIFPNWPLFSR